MNNITWLDLYNFLHDQANNINKVGNFNWNTPVVIHDAGCDPVGSTNCTTHVVDPSVPGPLPTLGASTAYAFARRLRKRTRLASTAS